MSATALQPRLTDAGLAAVFNASRDGLSATIAHIALGDAGYDPGEIPEMTALRSERARFPIASGEVAKPKQIHMTAIADGSVEFWVREIGFILSDGTLLAAWSDPDKALAFKADGVDMLLSYDLQLSALPADSVTVEVASPGAGLSLASELAEMAAAQLALMNRQINQEARLRALERRLIV